VSLVLVLIPYWKSDGLWYRCGITKEQTLERRRQQRSVSTEQQVINDYKTIIFEDIQRKLTSPLSLFLSVHSKLFSRHHFSDYAICGTLLHHTPTLRTRAAHWQDDSQSTNPLLTFIFGRLNGAYSVLRRRLMRQEIMRGQGSEFLIHLNVNTSKQSNKEAGTYHSIVHHSFQR
jgi:hypothetical protein